MLELRGRGQDDIGVVGGIGLEMVHHDGEQVVAREAGDDLVRLGAHRHGVVVVDDHGAHRRLRRGQRVAELRLVDDARPPSGEQVGALEGSVIEAVEIGGAEDDSARRVAPRADQRRQAGDGARRNAAAGVALHAVIEADRRRPDAAVFARKLHHLLARDAAGLRCPVGRIALDALRQRLEADGVLCDVVAVEHALRDQHVHHPERQRAVGAREQGDVLAALLRRQAAVGIDGDHFRAAALRLLHARPEVQVGNDRVRAPQQDQLRFVEALGIHADRAA